MPWTRRHGRPPDVRGGGRDAPCLDARGRSVGDVVVGDAAHVGVAPGVARRSPLTASFDEHAERPRRSTVCPSRTLRTPSSRRRRHAAGQPRLLAEPVRRLARGTSPRACSALHLEQLEDARRGRGSPSPSHSSAARRRGRASGPRSAPRSSPALASTRGSLRPVGLQQRAEPAHEALRHAPRMTAVDTRNGLTPMSIRRVSADGASFVCSVENTRWPVSAAWIAISAVSLSRISPTRMMFGAWRSIARRMRAKSSPIWCRTWHWLMPARWYSTGFSAVMILTFGPVQLLERGVERRRLARAGRPGDEEDAVRAAG